MTPKTEIRQIGENRWRASIKDALLSESVTGLATEGECNEWLRLKRLEDRWKDLIPAK